MKRLMTAALVVMAGASAFGQGVLYAPARTIDDQGIVLRTWGSGAITQTDEAAFQGVYSLRVSTRNYFQGGIINFGNTPDLSSMFAEKNNLLRLTYRLADMSMTLGGGPSRGGGGKLGDGGDAGGLSTGGAAAGGQTSSASQSIAQTLKNLRFVVTTTDGKRSEAYIAVSTNSSSDRGWRTAAIPLQAISGFDKTNKIVSSIAISGDSTSVFYVGDLRVINDATPLSGDTNVKTLNLALGDEVELYAIGLGGSSVLKYLWDFDSKDGVQIDAEGQVIKRKFRKPGKYTITVTIADAYGLKAPYQTTIAVTVNP